jgi:AraC family carnitine catabolism transcriptional activator
MERIDFLLVPGFSAMAFFSAVEPLRVANRLAGRPLFAWRIHSADGEPVAASSGMKIVADLPLGDLAVPGTLIICAGFRPERGLSRSGLAILRRFARDGGQLGALDTGIEILARAGLAGPGPVSIHWEAAPAFRTRWPDITVTDALYAIGERVFTCAGGTAALDLMLERLARGHGVAFAKAVAEQFIHDRIRPGGEQQRMQIGLRLATRNRAVLAVSAMMESHLETPLSSEALAGRAGLSVRQMERLFDRHLGLSPQRHYRRIRLERARQLLGEADVRVLDVALATGFDSASALARSYRAMFGTSPGAARKQAS